MDNGKAGPNLGKSLKSGADIASSPCIFCKENIGENRPYTLLADGDIHSADSYAHLTCLSAHIKLVRPIQPWRLRDRSVRKMMATS